MGILFALLCFGFAAVNDFVFKLFSRREYSRGLYLALIGIVWFALLWLPTGGWPESDGKALLWSCLSGVFSVAANLLLIEAMRGGSAGVCATIYRLNLVGVVLGATLFLGETLTPLQWCGILLAVAAVLSLLPGELRFGGAGGKSLLLATAAALLRAGMGLGYKQALLSGAAGELLLLSNAAIWFAAGLLYAVLREKIVLPHRRIGRTLCAYSLVSGVLVTAIVWTMAQALRYGDAAVVLPISQMSFLLTFLLGAGFLGERFTRGRCAALGCGAGAILLLAG